jgi:Fungal specific transcription factor domain
MGLHCIESDSIRAFSETRYRVWWGLFMLDTALSIMTGRPPSAGEPFCTAPLPVPYEEDLRNGRVAQVVANQVILNAFMISGVSESTTLAKENTSDHIDLAQHRLSKKELSEQSRQAISHTPINNMSCFFICVGLGNSHMRSC